MDNTFDKGTTYQIYTLSQIKAMAESGTVSLEEALKLAYRTGVYDLQRECQQNAVPMLRTSNHGKAMATSSCATSRAAEDLWKAVMDT